MPVFNFVYCCFAWRAYLSFSYGKDSQKNNLDFLLDCEPQLCVTKIFI
jgi:hypothetical protein